MNIGLCYDLRNDYLAMGYCEEETAEFDRPDTVDAIENAIRALGHATDRIGHIKNLVNRLAKGDRWDMVFSIAEGMFGIAREAQVPAICDAYEIPCVFSDALVNALTLHKGLTKRVIRDLGIATPDFAVIESPADIARVSLPYPLFAKPVAEGTAKGIDARNKIKAPGELDAVCRRLITQFKQPVLVETYLSGREFTVGIVGTGEMARSVGTIEIVLLDNAEPDVYTYVNKEECEERVRYDLIRGEIAEAAESLALAAWRGLGCRDGGRVDVRADANGVMNFLEVNPLAGLHPEHSDLPIICTKAGISYVELIRMIVDSAIERVKPADLRASRTTTQVAKPATHAKPPSTPHGVAR